MIIGAQGYTIREFAQNEADLRVTAKKLHDIGFKTLQVSAFGDIDPHIIREICDENELQIIVTHTNPLLILENTEKVIENHKALGCKHVGIGAMPEKYRGSLEGMRAFLKDFSEAADKLHAAGMKLHYHNHGFEYEKFEGKCLIDWMAEETDPEKWGFILDVHWTQFGGRSPSRQILDFAGRIDVLHLKDMKMVDNKHRFAAVMDGNMDFDAILEACEETGIPYAMIEQDDCYGEDPFKELALSAKNLIAAGCRF